MSAVLGACAWRSAGGATEERRTTTGHAADTKGKAMSAPSSNHLDLFELDEATVRCPYAALDDLRREPVRFVPRIGAFAVSGHAEAVQVLSDADLFSSRHSTGPHSATALARRIQAGDVDLTDLSPAEQERLQALARRRAAVSSAPALISADPPLHDEQREVVEPAFGPRRVAALEPFVSGLIGGLVDAFVDRSQADMIADFCRPAVVGIIGELLGVDAEDGARFTRWSDAFVLAVGNASLSAREMLEMFESIAEAYDYFTERLARAEVERSETDAGDDLMNVLASYQGRSRDVSLAERLQMTTQLMVAGNETTTHLLGSAVLRIASTPGLEEELRTDPTRLPDLVEEVLRLEAPTTGIYRLVTANTRLGGVDIPAGSFVFVDFHAANLDPAAFEAPRELRFDRPDKPQHLTFGHGQHSCMAADLARMTVRVALGVLLQRVRDLRLVVPQDALPYPRSFAARGPLVLAVAFSRNETTVDPAADAEHRPMAVESAREVAERVMEIVLRASDGKELPAWEPGAHIELLLPSGLTRQYSLCGDPHDRSRYVLAVLEEVDGRGGSAELHRVVRSGAAVAVRPPRNNFPFKAAPRYLFVAGGIGVTPILPMVEEAQRRGATWTLVYGGRSRSTMAYLDRVAAYGGGTVELWPEDERGRPDLPGLLAAQDEETLVYACGPTGLLDAVQAAHAQVHGLQPLRIERFAAAGPVDITGGAFEVVLAKTGKTLVVEEAASILETVRAVLPRLAFNCEEGYCGECETGVLEGVPDHRDDFLDEDEQAAGETMMICVSRCKGSRLVLDL
jgi:cytochrome P450/ferredoxin-NADP reductase